VIALQVLMVVLSPAVFQLLAEIQYRFMLVAAVAAEVTLMRAKAEVVAEAVITEEEVVGVIMVPRTTGVRGEAVEVLASLKMDRLSILQQVVLVALLLFALETAMEQLPEVG